MANIIVGSQVFTPDNLHEDDFPEYLWSYIDYKDRDGPERYLQDAIDDLKSGSSRRHFNNALRNAKCALHMKVDILCQCFGGEKFFKTLKFFPRKLDFLEDIGIVRPRIIDKINKIRNEVEHEYRDATQEEAEDFIDIVMLFIEATKYLNTRFPIELEFGPLNKITTYGVLFKLECKFKNGELVFVFHDKDGFDLRNLKRHSVNVGDENYRAWVKYIIKNNE